MINPDFALYARSCGAMGIKVTKKEELNNAMNQWLDHKGPALLEVFADVKLI